MDVPDRDNAYKEDFSNFYNRRRRIARRRYRFEKNDIVLVTVDGRQWLGVILARLPYDRDQLTYEYKVESIRFNERPYFVQEENLQIWNSDGRRCPRENSPPSRPRSGGKEIKECDRVSAKWTDGTESPGTVQKVSRKHIFVTFDEDGVTWPRLRKHVTLRRHQRDPKASSQSRELEIKQGDRVSAKNPDGRWYHGTVIKVEEGIVDVKYDDYPYTYPHERKHVTLLNSRARARSESSEFDEHRAIADRVEKLETELQNLKRTVGEDAEKEELRNKVRQLEDENAALANEKQELQDKKAALENQKQELQDEKEELEDEKLCLICYDKERSHLITPCFHLCLCHGCAGKIVNRCPMCKGQIGQIQRVFCI